LSSPTIKGSRPDFSQNSLFKEQTSGKRTARAYKYTQRRTHAHQKSSDRIFFTFCAYHHRISTSDIQQPRTSTYQHVAQTIVIFLTTTTNAEI